MESTAEKTAFDLLADAVTLQESLDTEIARINAEHEAALASVTTEYDQKLAEAQAALKSHPRLKEIENMLPMLFPNQFAAPKATTPKVTADKQINYVLVLNGTELTYANGEKITFERKVNGIAPSLKEILGDDLTGVALKNIKTNEIEVAQMGWRKVREAKAA